MAVYPDKDTFRTLAKQGNLVPVCADLMADFSTPVTVFSKLRALGGAFLFESVTGGEHIGRYSFAGARPRMTVTAYEKTTRIATRHGEILNVDTPADPLEMVKAQLKPFRPVIPAGMPPFAGGMVGFIGHEYIHRVETTVPVAAKDELGAPILHFMLMDTVVAFDHARQLLRLIVNAHIPEGADAGEVYDKAEAEVRELLELLARPNTLTPAPVPVVPADSGELPTGNFTRERFEAAVLASKEFIKSGDIFQIVLSQRFERPFAGDPLDLYRVLRYVNPSPYMFILETDLGFSVVGASPEVNVRLTGDRVEIRPLAGTRTRGKDEAEDLALEKDLLADTKERAEHLMLVDLARNDIGRVCAPGSVKVPDYASVERYSHVMHIVSQVEGRIAPGKDAFDLFRATFPAGTLSGAPKVRALQIISDLEGTKRGVYGGALGYFAFNGNHDSAIAIRTAFLKDGKAYVQAGAGVVADSDPAAEFMETVNKARGALKAVAIADGFRRNKS